MKRYLIGVLLGLALTGLACERDSSVTAKTTRRLIPMSSEQRRETLAALSPDQRLDVFLYAATRLEPPILLANEVAADAPGVLPALTSRMTTELDNARFAKLMLVLAAISTTRCSVEHREDILGIVRQGVSRISPEQRTLANQMLIAMERPAKELPPCPR